jgi:hypothetical protein
MADDLKGIAAEQAGLPAEWAERLRGETLTDLIADAQKLAAVVGTKTPPIPPETMREFAQRDPDAFNRMIESGEITTLDPNAPAPAPAAAEPKPDTNAGSFDAGHRRGPYDDAPRTMDAFRALAKTDPEYANDLIDRGIVDLRNLA